MWSPRCRLPMLCLIGASVWFHIGVQEGIHLHPACRKVSTMPLIQHYAPLHIRILVDQVATAELQLGKGCLLAKADIKAVYRLAALWPAIGNKTLHCCCRCHRIACKVCGSHVAQLMMSSPCCCRKTLYM